MKNFLKKLICIDIKLKNMKWKNLMNVINVIKNILNLDFYNPIKLKNINQMYLHLCVYLVHLKINKKIQ